MTARMTPAARPYPQRIQDRLDKIMPPGVPPLALFTTLARDERLFERFMAGNLLDAGHLDLRSRKIVVARVTALARSEYEWGVHVALFAERAGLSGDQIASIVHGDASDSCWSEKENALISACSQLHATCDLNDAAWSGLQSHYSDEAIMEILMLCGLYRLVAYLERFPFKLNQESRSIFLFSSVFLSKKSPTFSEYALTNALRLPLEPFAQRFPHKPAPSSGRA